MRSTCATAWFPSYGEVVSQRETPLILPLGSTQPALELVGGKGASLGRMAPGLLVPDGFTSPRWLIVASSGKPSGADDPGGARGSRSGRSRDTRMRFGAHAGAVHRNVCGVQDVLDAVRR